MTNNEQTVTCVN